MRRCTTLTTAALIALALGATQPVKPPLATQPATRPMAGRKPLAAPKPGSVTELDIKELGNFDYDFDKGGNIPADVKALSGTPFRTHGFMIPLDQAEKITAFQLVPSLFVCCVGGPPQIQHSITVHCPNGKGISYFPDEIIVEGTLKVEEKKEDGFIVNLFELEVTSVKPAPK